MHQRCPNEYETKTAISVHALLSQGIEAAFPTSSDEDKDALFVAIVDRLARMRGWAIRRYHEDEETA